jgi:hypothetical protein
LSHYNIPVEALDAKPWMLLLLLLLRVRPLISQAAFADEDTFIECAHNRS